MTVKITQPIVKVEVVSDNPPIVKKEKEVKCQTPKRLRRPDVLQGTTLRIKANGYNIYVTLNCDPKTGRPLELFFSSSHLESMGWVALATRLSSLILQSYDAHINNLKVLANEYIQCEIPEPMLKKVWGETKGRNHNGVIQFIGRNLLALHKAIESDNTEIIKDAITPTAEVDESNFPPCNDCGGEVRLMDGCPTCIACGASKCS